MKEILGKSGSIDKYESRIKAEEYAQMAWPELSLDKTSDPFYSHVASAIQSAIENTPIGQLDCVEVGFGAGRTLFDAYKTGRIRSLTGLEYSRAMLELTRNILTTDNVIEINGRAMIGKGLAGIDLKLGTVQALDFEDQSFDLVICINTLDRIEETRKGIGELARITKPTGHLVIASAFDYESVTSTEERLSPEKFEQAFVDQGCDVINQEQLKLIKHVNETSREFDEYIFIIRKSAVK